GRIDTVADGVHHTGPVLVGDLESGRDRVVAPGLPVGRVHPGRRHPDPDLTRARLGHLPVDQLEDVRVTVARVHDCLHGQVPTLSHPPGTTPDDDRHMDAYVVTGGGRWIATLPMDGGRGSWARAGTRRPGAPAQT